MTYVPLRVQSAYSILSSTIEVKGLAGALAARGLPAAALTDRGNLSAAMSFSAAAWNAGVQPIVAAAVPVRARPARRPGDPPPVDWLPLYVQNATGYRNLVALLSAAHLGRGREPGLALEALAGRTEGLLALTGGADGTLARLAAEGQGFEAEGERLLRLFGDRLFVEIGRSGEAVEARAEPALLDWAHRRGIPVVGTTIACFLEPGDHEAHDVMLCIADGTYLEAEDRRRSNPAQFLLSAEAFAARFADLPEAVANTLLLARRTAFRLEKREPLLPRLFADPADERATLDRRAAEGLEQRLAGRDLDPAPYRERLAFELDVIHGMGFSGYFLIVAEFIGWARAQGIPVGPGRGSGAGSVVAWALGITGLDPLAFGLLFERFLNPERRSMPDFDIDFCETRRDEVIAHVVATYGADRVAQIVTFGTLKARAVVKDVGRVLQMPYGEVDRLSKLIPANPADPWDLERALAGVPELAAAVEADPRVARLIRIARALEGRPRHASTHAAGIVIGDRPLVELVPLMRDPRSTMPVTQFDLKGVEEAGLVKFDFLGLKTLSVIDRAVKLLGERGIAVDLATLPLDDPETYALLTRGETVGVFQFESEGMRRALAQVRPDRFEDLVALSALFRPGPMDNIPRFAARKWGREPVDWLHPSLEPILKPTYGIIIYQEQVMQIAQVLAGYSLGEADLLRRAMGKKIKAEMDAQEARFVEGAVARGVAREQAAFIFRLVEKFAGYGFNRSHAAAYALVAYQTAWLKAHHPAAFFAATLAFDIADTDRLKQLVADMKRAGVRLLPPCVNRSEADFALEDAEGAPAVRYGLGALKGVGVAAMAEMVSERRRGGAFLSLDDWAARVDPRALNRRQVEALAAAGAFDSLEPARARVFAGAEALLAAAQAAARARAEGQGALFGGPGAMAVPVPAVPPWRAGEQLAKEREAFGFYLSGHPAEAHPALLKAQGVMRSSEVAERRGGPASGRVPAMMAGLVDEIRWRTPAGGGPERRFLLVDCSDGAGPWSASCFAPELFATLTEAARSSEPLLFEVELSWRAEDEPPRIAIVGARPLASAARGLRLRLVVRLAPGAEAGLLVSFLRSLPRGGRSEVEVEVPSEDVVARLRLGRDFELEGASEADLLCIPGVEAARIEAVGSHLRRVA